MCENSSENVKQQMATLQESLPRRDSSLVLKMCFTDDKEAVIKINY